MFEIRPINKKIAFMYFGIIPERMPSGKNPKNGDSVTLKYEQFEIEVQNITTIAEKKFSGVIASISDQEKEAYEIGSPLNIRLNQKIEFNENMIFNCARNS